MAIGPQKGGKVHTLQTILLQLTPLNYIPVGHMAIKTCENWQDPVKIIACLENPLEIRQILDHLKSKEAIDQQS